ncbi:MAG: protein-disulfide reductase DsbD [Rhodocyclaceae bacterium]|nr:protein-disulfide reductase DsbD [Rhodocyclaceae bacterium]
MRRLLLPLFLLLTLLSAPLRGQEPLDPEKAFRFSARLVDGATVEARWQIADGYYMYRDKFRFSSDVPEVKLGEPRYPKGKVKDDEIFGKVETYRGDLRILIPLEGPAGTAFTLKTSSQGCADLGVCYPPLPQQAGLTLAAASTPAAPAPSGSAPSAAADESEDSRLARLLQESGLWAVLLTFLGLGVLLAFTPCVLPMVPILSGIIVNHGHAVSHGRAFVLSLAYVLGMAVTYAAAGVAAGFSGTLLTNALQNAWVLGAFGLLFALLSLSMFGFYQIQLPSALQSRLSAKANAQGGSLPAIAFMGALSALIVGPCVTAPLAAALLYIARTGDAALGGAALFALAIGMGLPLLLVGTFSRTLLPKPGPWMDAVNRFFGVLLLATALWIVTPVIPAWAPMAGWAALLIVPAIYMHALDPLPPHASGWHRLWKGVGVAMLILGAAMLVGLLGGARDPLQPLGFLKGASAAGGAGSPTAAPQFQRVKSVADLEAQLARADRPVMLDFYADWCISCKEMEKLTFADPGVAARLAGFRLLQADVTANSTEDAALLKRFGLVGPPGIIFFDPAGREVAGLRVVGFQDAAAFGAVLDRALAARRG